VKFDRIRLENFKPYEDVDLRLGRGVTVVHGVNGSGKSSLLEACFFALYGARALETTLDEVVTIGAEECRVELWFTHDGADYHVRRRIRHTGERAQTAACVLEPPEGTVEGARDVRRRVSELLRMDADAFVNCAYVRQGEVNKLINAPPGDRQDVIDELLQLGTLEEYRQRASEARLGVDDVLSDKRGALAELEERIETKADRDLHERLNDLRTELSDVEGEIERFEENREDARQALERAESVLEEYEEFREELAGIEDDVERLTGAITDAEREREAATERAREHREAAAEHREAAAELLAEVDADLELGAGGIETVDRAAVADCREELVEERERLDERIREHSVEAQKHADEAESARERAEELEEEAERTREEAEEIETELAETRERIADRREEIEALDDRIEQRRERFEDAPVEFGAAERLRDERAEALAEAREAVTETEAALETARERVREAEVLLEQGNCPACGQPVEGAPHVDSLEGDRERVAELEERLEQCRAERERAAERHERATELVDLEDAVRDLESERRTAARLVEEREAAAEETADRVASLREEADELEAEAERRREAAAEAAAAAERARGTVGECNAERSAVAERLDRLDRLDELLAAAEEAAAAAERASEERESIDRQNDLRRERLAEKRERRDELRERIDDDRVERAREERERASSYLEEVADRLAALRERRDELQAEAGAVENELDELAALRERREEIAAVVERLEALYAETETLQEAYAGLRTELRQRNVRTLEKLLNETFELVYGNDAYDRIELDGDYELTVYQKDGSPLEPDQLSGGERALFNLSLRCAIYRLLAEGIEGTAPLPPLILDEPTVFLDAGHVSRLLELVETMRSQGVEQIVVVSHDDELVGAADDLVRVSKDPTTNRSSAERREPVGPPA